MRRRQQEDFVASSTLNDIEMVQHVATQDAQVTRLGIRESCELTAHRRYPAIFSR
jgi:hypothetical protein